ncbi:hypothetical protein CJ030_MR7G024238 [Morella rubra]|uniref:Uncharacterized protein n=1 Tax=Morella rubra TaxID=262757 RepID=A0A6A1V6S4_9ROSI|nr:hypothetical protein CJ030_MR7G024238 [Morella rubra]
MKIAKILEETMAQQGQSRNRFEILNELDDDDDDSGDDDVEGQVEHKSNHDKSLDEKLKEMQATREKVNTNLTMRGFT